MNDIHRKELELRIGRLERRLHWTWSAAAVLVLAAVALACRSAGGAADAHDNGVHRNSGILRVRGLVVEDAEGRARLVLGAPVPVVGERVRGDAPVGLVLLGPDGHDRLQLGVVGGPQMGGNVQARQSPATGLMVNDEHGDERGGFGVFENGQVGFGLDYPSQRELIVAAVMPDRGMAGMVFSADVDENPMRAMILTTREGETVIQTSDASGASRAVWTAPAKGAPKLQVLDESGNVLHDAFTRP
jgi:hypothetical protein